MNDGSRSGGRRVQKQRVRAGPAILGYFPGKFEGPRRSVVRPGKRGKPGIAVRPGARRGRRRRGYHKQVRLRKRWHRERSEGENFRWIFYVKAPIPGGGAALNSVARRVQSFDFGPGPGRGHVSGLGPGSIGRGILGLRVGSQGAPFRENFQRALPGGDRIRCWADGRTATTRSSRFTTLARAGGLENAGAPTGSREGWCIVTGTRGFGRRTRAEGARSRPARRDRSVASSSYVAKAQEQLCHRAISTRAGVERGSARARAPQRVGGGREHGAHGVLSGTADRGMGPPCGR